MADERRRRASPGYTYDPCPGCGEQDGQLKKGTVCRECQKLLAAGKEAMARGEQMRVAGVERPYRWTERPWAYPGYYGDYEFAGHMKHDDQDELKEAMFGMVKAISVPAPPGTPYRSPDVAPQARMRTGRPAEPDYLPWPYVLDLGRPADRSIDSYDWPTMVLMAPAARDAVNRLDQAVRRALVSVYTKGKETGGKVLRQLATGEVTLDDFDDALLTRDERQAKGRR